MLNSRTGRRVLASGAAAIGVVALAVTSALPSASAVPSAGSSWRIAKQVPGGGSFGFATVTAASHNVIWAFSGGNKLAAWRRTGSNWKKFAVQGPVISASATSPSDVWAMTQSGKALRWTGSAWATSQVFRGGGQIKALGPKDVWVFGSAWYHYNGRTWARVTSASGLEGASALSDKDIWSFDRAGVAHWNGHVFTRTSLKRVLPQPTEFSSPGIVGIYAQSKNSIWAFGNGDTQDAGGPLYILHDNGHGWRLVVTGKLGSNGGSAVAPDGHDGLWIPLDGASGQPTTMAHFSGGKLTTVKLPVSGRKITLESVALIPGTTEAIAGGFTHSANFTNIASTVLQYSP